MTGNYKSGDNDRRSAVKGREESVREEKRDERGHSLVEDYNSR